MATVYENQQRRLIVIIWLSIVSALVCFIVLIGGITRLTGSGLSMVDWQPISGVLPPTSESEWQETFNDYKQYPEYKIKNKDMELSEFKKIFFWEYLHRMLGRLIGIVFALPYFFFLICKYFDRRLAVKLFAGLCLGGAQGLMGWYMVRSGLVDIPDVSHYRLAAHLFLAFLVAAILLWFILDLLSVNRQAAPLPRNYFWGANLIIAVLVLQIIYGAFVAGRDAGYGYNTFPLMGDSFIPAGMFSAASILENLTSNNTTIQFIHRTLAWILSLLVLPFCAFTILNAKASRQKVSAIILLIAFALQFSLGVATLLLHVPLNLAVIHQVGALLLLGAAVAMRHSLR